MKMEEILEMSDDKLMELQRRVRQEMFKRLENERRIELDKKQMKLFDDVRFNSCR